MRYEQGLRHWDLICDLQVTSVNTLTYLLLANGSWLKSSRDLTWRDIQVLKAPALSLCLLLCATASKLFEILIHAIVGWGRHLLPKMWGCAIRQSLILGTVVETSKVSGDIAPTIQHALVLVSKQRVVAPGRIECEAWVAAGIWGLYEGAHPTIVHLHHKMLAATQHQWVVLIIEERWGILAKLLLLVRVVGVHERLHFLVCHVRVALLMLS